jgi:hypothetical protein
MYAATTSERLKTKWKIEKKIQSVGTAARAKEMAYAGMIGWYRDPGCKRSEGNVADHIAEAIVPSGATEL